MKCIFADMVLGFGIWWGFCERCSVTDVLVMAQNYIFRILFQKSNVKRWVLDTVDVGTLIFKFCCLLHL